MNFSISRNYENAIENDIEKQIFKENVVITKNKMKLYTDKAIYYPEKNEVFLVDDVKMYDQGDSLFCDSLILYDTEYKKFEALKNVHFHQSTNEIICGKLKYETLQDTSKKLIRIFDNGEIIDSQRKVKGDSIILSFLFQFNDFARRNWAAVPLDTTAQYLHLKYFFRRSSNSCNFSP